METIIRPDSTPPDTVAAYPHQPDTDSPDEQPSNYWDRFDQDYQEPLTHDKKNEAYGTAMLYLKDNIITPEEALERVLLAYDALPDYGNTLDPRIYKLLDIENDRSAASAIRTIAERLKVTEASTPKHQRAHAYDMKLDDFAAMLERGLSGQAFSLYGQLNGHQPEYYDDSSASLSGLLLEEQWSGANYQNLYDFAEKTKEAPLPVDLGLINRVVEAKNLFDAAQATELTTEDKKAAFAYLLGEFDDLHAAIDSLEERHERFLPATRAVIMRLHAQTLRDIGVLSNDLTTKIAFTEVAVGELGRHLRLADSDTVTAASFIDRAIADNPNIRGFYKIHELIHYFESVYRSSLEDLRQEQATRLIATHAIGNTATVQHAA